MAVQPAQQQSSPVERVDLQRGGRVVAWLQWRSRPRDAVGWYLQRRGRPARRLAIDAGIDALARDTVSDPDVCLTQRDGSGIRLDRIRGPGRLALIALDSMVRDPGAAGAVQARVAGLADLRSAAFVLVVGSDVADPGVQPDRVVLDA